MNIDTTLEQAIAFQETGKRHDAIGLYLGILQAQPNQVQANHNLGQIFMQGGQYGLGLPYLEKAWKNAPHVEQYCLAITECLLKLDRPHDALRLLDNAVRRKGFNGAETQQLLQLASSIASAERPSLAVERGISASFKAQNWLELETQLTVMLLQYPNWDTGWQQLATVLFAQNKPVAAETAIRHAVELVPNNAAVQYDLGVILRAQDQRDAALQCFRKALDIKPDYVEAHNNLAAIYQGMKRNEMALKHYRQALLFAPGNVKLLSNASAALADLNHFGEALQHCRQAVAIEPNFAEAHNNLGCVLRMAGMLDEAALSFRRALEIKPDYCDSYSNMLFCLTHQAKMNAQDLFSEHLRFAERFEAPLSPCWPLHENSRDPQRRIEVAFVSADLYHHAVANFIEPVLQHLSKSTRLSLHVYYNNTVVDSVTERLQGCLEHWNSVVGMSDTKLAEKIRTDGIDILIDLSGHTTQNRLLTFARKPAPVQASWIGYPGTTGLQAMDYYLADRFFLPLGQFDSQFTEKIVRMPASAPFLPFEGAPPVNVLPALSNGYVTFGSFNRPSKLSHAVIALWAQLLRALPDSRMLLGGMPDTGQYDTLIDLFTQEGIARERLDFHPRSGMDDYLALHHHVDISLDTFPYNGGTTTCHALWMGVPTLTLAGSTAAGRPGAALLGHAGLDELVAHDAADFVQKGLSCVGNLAALSDIRAGLRERFAKSAMGQPAVVAAGVERALRIMWQRWCAGLPPESFEVSMQDMGNVMQEAGK